MRSLNYDPAIIFQSVEYYLGSVNVVQAKEKKPCGSNPGLLFDYTQGDLTERYFLKANEVTWGANPDAREIICYLLLKHISVGPAKCLFIPSNNQTTTVVYIATLKVG
jgi:hypothetical protein